MDYLQRCLVHSEFIVKTNFLFLYTICCQQIVDGLNKICMDFSRIKFIVSCLNNALCSSLVVIPHVWHS